MSMNLTAHNSRYQTGFTLIELAIVLVIIGVLVGSILGTLGARIDNTRRIETQEALENIKLALYGFAMSQDPVRLPCPDATNDGLEDRTGGSCTRLNRHGNLPWATLGINRGDAWASTFSYWAADEYSNTAGFGSGTDATGVGQVNDSAGGNMISENVAAVIFSHGKNLYGSVDVNNSLRSSIPAGAAYDDERENLDTDGTAPVLFISRPVAGEGAATAYDDITTWISEFELKGMMAKAGKLSFTCP
jgi:prepilin-type N-terminal cleavage/methylation domain-containing protein